MLAAEFPAPERYNHSVRFRRSDFVARQPAIDAEAAP